MLIYLTSSIRIIYYTIQIFITVAQRNINTIIYITSLTILSNLSFLWLSTVCCQIPSALVALFIKTYFNELRNYEECEGKQTVSISKIVETASVSAGSNVTMLHKDLSM